MGLLCGLVRDIVNACVDDEAKLCEKMYTQLTGAEPLAPQWGFPDAPSMFMLYVYDMLLMRLAIFDQVQLSHNGPSVNMFDFFQSCTYIDSQIF